MRVRLRVCIYFSVLICSLLPDCGRAQLYFDPAAFSFGGSRGALSHALESGPRLPRFLIVPPPPPPAPTAAATAAPSPSIAADAASPASDAASPVLADELQDPSFLVDPGTPISPSQEAVTIRHGKHSTRAATPPPPLPDQAAPAGGPTPAHNASAAPLAAPSAAPGLNSSLNGSLPSHPTQIKDLLKPAPPAPPILLPASPVPAPAPIQAPPAQVDTGQPKAGRKDGQDSCEQQGMQGECNACVCCCSPKGSGGFVNYYPKGCDCQKDIRTPDIWLTLVMSAILVLPAILISIYFAGALPMSPHRDALLL